MSLFKYSIEYYYPNCFAVKQCFYGEYFNDALAVNSRLRLTSGD